MYLNLWNAKEKQEDLDEEYLNKKISFFFVFLLIGQVFIKELFKFEIVLLLLKFLKKKKKKKKKIKKKNHKNYFFFFLKIKKKV